ncbi:MAG: aldo/keto reductase [Bacteroidota bacterium]
MSEKKIHASASGVFTIGRDMPVYRMGFGAMRITGEGVWGPPKDKSNALAVLKANLDLGINFIDTADSYGPNVSEELIAEALHPYPEELIIATKGGFTRQGPNQWTMNGRPEHLEEALKGSLQRLKLDRIDLYQLHRIDPKVPMDETLGKLRELQQQGYFRHFGLSEVDADQLAQAARYITITTVQNRFSITYRKSQEVLERCSHNNIAFIPWYPLDAGAMENPEIQAIASKYQVSIYQLALAWLLDYSPNILPIPGTSSVQHLHDNVAAAQIKMDLEDLHLLNQLQLQ